MWLVSAWHGFMSLWPQFRNKCPNKRNPTQNTKEFRQKYAILGVDAKALRICRVYNISTLNSVAFNSFHSELPVYVCFWESVIRHAALNASACTENLEASTLIGWLEGSPDMTDCGRTLRVCQIFIQRGIKLE